MNPSRARLSLALVLLGLMVSFSLAADKKPTARFEIRKAEEDPDKELQEATIASTGKKIYLHKAIELTEADILEATTTHVVGEQYGVSIKFTKKGAEKMAKLTQGHMNKPIAVLLDGKVLVAPVVRSKISDKGMISPFSEAECDRIVKALKKPE